MTTNAMTANEPLTRAPRPRSGAFLAAWGALGITAGMALAYGLAAMHRSTLVDGTTTLTPAAAVGVAVLCYLAAAATGTRWVAWLGVPVFSGLAFAGLLGFLPWWVLFLLAAVVLCAVGAALGGGRTTAVQAIALIGYFGVAVLALYAAPRLGLALAGVALAAHAVWDVHHYRRDIVVSRSLAVFCIGLDLTVGALCLVLAIVS